MRLAESNAHCDMAGALTRLARFAKLVEAWLTVAIWTAGLAACVWIALWWPERDHSALGAYAAMTLMGFVGATVYVQRTVWHHLYRGTLFNWRPKALQDPALAPAHALIEHCANGDFLLETYLGERVDKSFCRNVLGPLLTSEFEEERLQVRSELRGRNYGPQLHVVLLSEITAQLETAPKGDHGDRIASDMPTASDIGLGIGQGTSRTGTKEAPLQNFDPKMQWLVGGAWAQFMLGLDSFLDTLPPHKHKWHRIVLTVGRRELRNGGQYGARNHAVRQIIAALKAANEKYPDVDKGDATTTIKKLLAGQSGTKDITGHFLRVRSEESKKSKDSSESKG